MAPVGTRSLLLTHGIDYVFLLFRLRIINGNDNKFEQGLNRVTHNMMATTSTKATVRRGEKLVISQIDCILLC